jgi:catechol 2,3-dioxygenase-like lactoylglutathione lyase family enzyme
LTLGRFAPVSVGAARGAGMAIPIFPVRDLREAGAFWSSAGLVVEEYDPGYAFVRSDGEEIVHLAVEPALDPERNFSACYVHVRDVQGWHDRLAAAGLPVTPLRDQPWGMTEFSVRDPDRNLVRIGCAD